MKISTLQQLRCIQKHDSRNYNGHFELTSSPVAPVVIDVVDNPCQFLSALTELITDDGLLLTSPYSWAADESLSTTDPAPRLSNHPPSPFWRRSKNRASLSSRNVTMFPGYYASISAGIEFSSITVFSLENRFTNET